MLRWERQRERRVRLATRARSGVHEAGHLVVALALNLPVVEAVVHPGFGGGHVVIDNESLHEKRGSPATPDELATVRAASVAAFQLVQPGTPLADPAHNSYDDDLRRPGAEIADADAYVQAARIILSESGHDLRDIASAVLAGEFRQPFRRRISERIRRKKDA